LVKRDVVEFGIPGFDKLVGGGIPPGTCILMLSPPMAELKLFNLEFVYRGIKDNIPALYVTLDDSPENMRLKAMRYGWPLENAENNNLLKWIDAYSIHSEADVKDTEAIRRVGGPLALSDISIAISGAQSLFKSQSDVYKVVFDSISTLLLYNKPETIYRFLEVITAKIKNTNGVALFTLGEGMHDPHIEMTIRHMMDGTIKLGQELDFEIMNFPTTVKNKKGKLDLTKNGFKLLR
jgi:KaiC/GvpD/RAD55 family RecA-like ATPase